MPTKDFESCVTFNLNVEYVRKNANEEMSAEERARMPLEILSVRPPQLKGLWKNEERIIRVTFDRAVTIDDLADGPAAAHSICQLVSEHNQNNVVSPTKVYIEGAKTLSLHFYLGSNLEHVEPGACYSLRCTTRFSKSKEPEKIFQPMPLNTHYCLSSTQEHEQSADQQCNPRASPKKDSSGRCICASPYTGSDCESCVDGYSAQQKPLWDNKDNKMHTECAFNAGNNLGRSTCSGHGSPKRSWVEHEKEIECQCDDGYTGRFCDYCANKVLAFPDCDPTRGDSANIYDPKQIHEFLNRNHYELNGYSTKAERIFPKGQLEPSIFNEECGWVDYPDDLDRIEYMREFNTGEFHVADIYTVNHKQDNVMRFVPKELGVIKVLAQQPEEKLASEPTYDIEIGIYDSTKKRFVAQGMNSHYRLPSGQSLKLEQASVSFEIT